MVKELAEILDETSLYDGIKNLATSYYDTISEFNRTQEPKRIRDKKLPHISFQTVKDLDWNVAVSKILGDKTFGDIGEAGQGMLQKGLEVGASLIGGEAIAPMIAGILTDLVFDKAFEAFAGKEVDEVYEEGTWLYVDRGKENSTLIRAEEMASETAMFGDSDTILQRDTARQLYSPGFYVNHVRATDEHIVYLFDIEKVHRVARTKIRVADSADRLRFDQDAGMTTIRELYFRRQMSDNIQYAKFQTGDEAIYRGKNYVVVRCDQETVVLKDVKNNILEVDPQACTSGPRTHWRAQEPGQFRTASFTFTVGEFVYRPLQMSDAPLTKRANGVLCCIFYYNGNQVEVYDCWTGMRQEVNPGSLVKPPLPVRPLLDNQLFTMFRYRVLKSVDPAHIKLGLRSQYEGVCWGYDTTLTFAETEVLGGDVREEQITLGETRLQYEIKQEQTKFPDKPTEDTMPDSIWAILGGILMMFIIL